MRFNTDTKEMTVTKDGQQLNNVDYLSAGKTYDEGKYYCSVCMTDDNRKTDGTVVYHTLSASKEDGNMQDYFSKYLKGK